MVLLMIFRGKVQVRALKYIGSSLTFRKMGFLRFSVYYSISIFPATTFVKNATFASPPLLSGLVMSVSLTIIFASF